MTQYFDDTKVTSLAIPDFGLTREQVQRVAGELELIVDGTRYSLREIAGTAWAMRHEKWLPLQNRLNQKAFYCSAFVRHVFGLEGLNLAGDIAVKNTGNPKWGQAAEVDGV